MLEIGVTRQSRSRFSATSRAAAARQPHGGPGSTILVVDSRDPTRAGATDLRAFIPPGAEVTARTPFRRTPAPCWKRGTRSRKPPRSHREGAGRSRGAKLRQRESRARGGPAGRRGGARPLVAGAGVVRPGGRPLDGILVHRGRADPPPPPGRSMASPHREVRL